MSQVSKGFIWSSIERFSTQGISFIVSIIVARLVLPESYGIVALIQVFTSFAQIFIDSGFGNALIQKQDRNETDYCTVFFFNFVISTIIYVILFIGAPYIAFFYNEPKLTLLTRVIGVNLFFSSFSIVQRTRLTINLDFKTQSKASMTATMLSGGVGISMAYMGMEYWAIVAQQLVMQLVLTIMLFFLSQWMPKAIFSKDSFRYLFSFGSKLLVNNLITGIYLNIYNLVIGKWYSPASLAYYNRAFTLTQIPSTNIEMVLQRIIFPVTCSLQNDHMALKDAYYKYLHLTHVVILPILTIFCVLSEPLVKVLLTDKWLPAAPYISIYCINFMFYAWLDQSVSVINAIGRSDINLKATLLKRPVSFIILFATISFGVKVICIGVVINTIIELVISLYYNKKILGYNISEQIRKQFDISVICISLAFILYVFLYFTNNCYFQLLVGGFVGVFITIILIFLFKMPESKMLFSLLKKNGKMS